MIKKILSLLVGIIFIIILSILIINKNNKKQIRSIAINQLSKIFTWGFDTKIICKGKFITTDKIDIVISNHLFLLDSVYLLSIVQMNTKKPIYVIALEHIVKIPGLKYLVESDLLIDKDRCIKNLDNINEPCIIFIFPEGEIINNIALKRSHCYSIDNNLHVFNNILYPRMRGLYQIIKGNKMGNIIDISTYTPDIDWKSINSIDTYPYIFKKEIGPIYNIIKTYKIKQKSQWGYDNFKKWFLKIWIKKDIILDKYNHKAYE